MSLPIKALDRLFTRLLATYGSEFRTRYAGVPDAEIKSAWAFELAGFASDRGLEAVAWALSNLPERCPNVIEFRNLCRRAPEPDSPALAAPDVKADPERVRVEFARLAELRIDILARGEGPRLGWAHAILARRDAGAKVAPAVLSMAQSALGGAWAARSEGA